MKSVKKVAESAAQSGHSVPYQTTLPGQAIKDGKRAAEHNRDMARIERLHPRGQK